MIIHLNYTPKEAYQLMTEVFKEKIKIEIQEPKQILRGLKSLHNISLEKSLVKAIKLSSKRDQGLSFLAAYYALKQNLKMNNTLRQIEDELNQLTKQREYVINSTSSSSDKQKSLESISKKTSELTFKKHTLLSQIQVDSYTEITSTTIPINTSQ